MSRKDLNDKFIKKFNNRFCSFIHLIIKYIRWNIQLGARQACIPLLNKSIKLYYIYFSFLKLLNPGRYTDADPLKIIWVNPQKITKTCEDSFGRPLKRGAVYSGNWDKNVSLFMENTTPKNIENDFDSDSICSGRKRAQIENIIDNLLNEGYMTQKELLTNNPSETKSLNNDPVPTILNEITVNIGRDGEFLWRTYGQHRLAIAKLLEIDKVPVIVCVRHKKWQKIRDEIRKAKNYDEAKEKFPTYIEHPDLDDILSDLE